jgi:hypothetical protein
MTVSLPASDPIRHAGDGSRLTFTFPFEIFAATDLIVGFVVAGIYQRQTMGYIVPPSAIGNPAGGQITFARAPPLGTTVDLRTEVPPIQPASFARPGSRLPEAMTTALDRLTRTLQDVYRQTYTFGIHGPDTESAPWTALPPARDRAGGALMFDSSGLPTIGVPPTGNITGEAIARLLSAITAVAPLASLRQTAAEVAAGVLPVDYSWPPGYVDRYGINTVPGTTDMTAAVHAALKVAAQSQSGVSAVVFLASSYVISSGVVVSSNTVVRGAGLSATLLRAVIDAGTHAVTLGTSDSALSTGPGLRDLSIQLVNPGTAGVLLRATENAEVRNVQVYSLGHVSGLVGFCVRGGKNVSNFFNVLQNCYAEHVHVGYQFTNLGTQATQSTLIQCSAVGETAADPECVGMQFVNPGDGLGSTIIGGYFEDFGTGVSFHETVAVVFSGTTFEGSGMTDVAWSSAGNDRYVSFFGMPNVSNLRTSGVRNPTCAIYQGAFLNGVQTSLSGSFTARLYENSGARLLGSGTANYRIALGVVSLTLPAVTGASAHNDLSIMGLPVAAQPKRPSNLLLLVENGGVANALGLALLSASSDTITMLLAGSAGASATGWAATGVKGIPLSQTVSYPLG